MQFKINVFRDVLIYLQDNLSYDKMINSQEVQIKDYLPDDIAYHIELIAESKFIDYHDVTGMGERYRSYLISRLTMAGHEFISSIKNDTVWKKIETASGVIGVEVIKSSIPILLAYVKLQLGIP